MDTLLRFKAQQKQQGFSLVELMVVVAIIGILAALAVPRFQMFQAKARQSEAKNNLSHIYTLEEAYYGDNETYGAVPTTGGPDGTNCPGTSVIGFRVAPCTKGKIRYAYSTTAASTTAWAAQALSTANTIVPGCATADKWTIDNNKILTPVADTVKTCK